MYTFKQFIELNEGAGHLTHIEDLVLYGGVNGTRDAINALRSLRDMLAGHSKNSVNVTTKFDGAPSVFTGVDPTDGQFFVAKKGIFNKNPKVYKSHADIDADTSGDLSVKLKAAFDNLKDLGISNIIQGDMMFTKSDLKTQEIDGVKYVTFHPNTIVYAVPVNTELGKQIINAEVGIVFHTSYSGKDFESMTPSYTVNLNTIKKTPKVWMISADLQDLSGTASMTQKETDEVTSLLSTAGKIFKQISSSTLKEIESNATLAQTIETFNNTYVRKGEPIGDTKKHVDNLIKYVYDKYQKEIDKLKTEKGKDRKASARDEFLMFFSDNNKANLKLMFDLQKVLVEAKLYLINKLNEIGSMKTFLKTTNGFKVTSGEGFVASDTIKGGVVKLVDRLEFSWSNFDPSIIKGWMGDTRN